MLQNNFITIDGDFTVLLEKARAMNYDSNAPASLLCPIGRDFIKDPVIGSDGHTYERCNIEQALAKNSLSPITREKMNIEDLTPNRGYHDALAQFINDQEDIDRRKQTITQQNVVIIDQQAKIGENRVIIQNQIEQLKIEIGEKEKYKTKNKDGKKTIRELLEQNEKDRNNYEKDRRKYKKDRKNYEFTMNNTLKNHEKQCMQYEEEIRELIDQYNIKNQENQELQQENQGLKQENLKLLSQKTQFAGPISTQHYQLETWFINRRDKADLIEKHRRYDSTTSSQFHALHQSLVSFQGGASVTYTDFVQRVQFLKFALDEEYRITYYAAVEMTTRVIDVMNSWKSYNMNRDIRAGYLQDARRGDWIKLSSFHLGSLADIAIRIAYIKEYGLIPSKEDLTLHAQNNQNQYESSSGSVDNNFINETNQYIKNLENSSPTKANVLKTLLYDLSTTYLSQAYECVRERNAYEIGASGFHTVIDALHQDRGYRSLCTESRINPKTYTKQF